MYGRLGTINRDANDHSGTISAFLERHHDECQRRLQTRPEGWRQFIAQLLGRIADYRNLRPAWESLRHKGGTAPGPDGRSYDDYSEQETRELLRDLSQSISGGTYRPGPERTLRIQKSSGRGTRELRLQNVPDRVVQRGVVQIVQPLLDPTFHRWSFGFRPGRSHLHALAQTQALAVRQNRWTWVCEDIRDAFGSVPLGPLFQIVERRLPDKPLVEFLRRVGGGDTPGRKHGLRQGGPLSPLLLNLYLDRVLDQPWSQRHATIPLLRYADDLLLLCSSPEEAEHAHHDLRQLLCPPGMPLKGDPETAIRRLDAQATVTWLGFNIRRSGDGLRYRVADRLFEVLSDRLEQLHFDVNAPLRADAVVAGWIGQIGPAYGSNEATRGRVCDQLRAVAAARGFDEVLSKPELLEQWKRANRRWRRITRFVQEGADRPPAGDGCGQPGSSTEDRPIDPESAPF